MTGTIKNIAILLLLVCVSLSAAAQEEYTRYRRSSIYSIMINHTNQQFSEEIRKAFVRIPVPDKYNDHDLSVKVVSLPKKLKGAASNKENELITEFLDSNLVASRLVAKWFNRDFYTGVCNMDLVKERGLYDATEFDKQLAARSARGKAMLEDAGEDLIGNTFVLVNDIRYIDRSKTMMWVGVGLSILSAGAGAAMMANGATVSQVNSLNQSTQNIAQILDKIKGFKVKINTFLYKLVWDEEVAGTFYETQYAATPDESKRMAFENGRGGYRLEYVGKVESSGSEVSYIGVDLYNPIPMVRKACQRAIDENIVDLQTEFEAFRTRTPILTSEPITASIGMKEGVNAKSKFEVLERVENEDGSCSYKRVGVVAPVENQIWDNRYMAVEEGAQGALLGKTTFRKVSGATPQPGMLIREI